MVASQPNVEGQQPPGPHGWPWLGSLLAMQRNLPEFCANLATTYGDVAAFRAGIEHAYLISSPQHIKQLLRRDVSHFHKGRYTQRLETLFGAGLLSSNGDFWRARRQVLQPAFGKSHVGNWFDLIIENTDTCLGRWYSAERQKQSVNLADEMLRLVQTIIVPILFGRTIQHTVSTQITGAINTINTHLLSHYLREMVLNGILNRLPIKRVRRFHQAVHQLQNTIDHLLAQSDSASDPDAIVSYLRDNPAWQDTGQQRDELVSLFIAGQETTAVALTWTLYYLATHPTWSERLYRESQLAFANERPTIASLNALTSTRWVINEALRLRPPVYVLGRRPITDQTLGECHLPADALVFISPYSMHRHPKHWHQPEHFNPERFSPNGCQDRPRYAFFPFGGGPRVCLGQHLAMLEITLIVARIMQRFSLHLVPNQAIETIPGITLRPRGGIPVYLARR